ncbi:MAG: DUF465 domain-containing protein [Leptospiraceae bacterium]|nr:DUF465 domain-containing protein [Leptospiraceae bacterium]MDW8306674.1 DUF465 domain-containing protein [Leptospiraceae bacterium]
MIHESHELAAEFPEWKEKIHNLKRSDRHFARLFEEYENINWQILRIERGEEGASDAYLEDLKKKRLYLKDELFHILKRA